MKFLKTKCDQNIHQNAPNCTILKKILGGACPRTPLAKRMALPCQSEKNISCPPPPLPNPGDAPDTHTLLHKPVPITWCCIMCKPKLKCSLESLARLSTLS